MQRILCLIFTVAIVALPVLGEEKDLFTNVYVVPPTFRSVKIDQRPNAIEILSSAGIPFPEGGSAVYNPATSQLIVRNTQENMELVEAYIDSTIQKVEKQIYVIFREIEFDENPGLNLNFEEFSSLAGSDPNQRRRTFSDRETFLEELSRPPRTDWPEQDVVKAGIIGVFTDPQFQLLVRGLKKRISEKNVVAPPSIMARSGQLALVEVAEKRWGVDAVLGADEYTIELELFFPTHGEAYFSDNPYSKNKVKVTIWDGQTVAWAEEKKNGHYRIVFVTAQIMDPAGMPFHEIQPPSKPAQATTFKASPQGIDQLLNQSLSENQQEKPGNVETASMEQIEQDASPGTDITVEQKQAVKEADENALRGSQLMGDGEYGSAVTHYARALDLLPQHDLTIPRRDAYEKQMRHAQTQIDSGETKFHVVRKGESLFEIALQHGLSTTQVKAANRTDSDVLVVGQLLIIPGVDEVEPVQHSRIENALKQVIIPSYEIRDVSLREAVGLIHIALLANLDSGLFPDLAPIFVFEDLESIEDAKITLRLGNVPVAEALRYVAELANCKYELEGEQVIIRRK